MPDYQHIDALLTVSGILVLSTCVIVIAYVILEGHKRMQYSSPGLMKGKRAKERRGSELKSLFTPMDVAGIGIRENRRRMPDRRLGNFS